MHRFLLTTLAVALSLVPLAGTTDAAAAGSKQPVVRRGEIVALDATAMTMDVLTRAGNTITVRTFAKTAFRVDGGQGAFTDLAVGMKTRVTGKVNRQSKVFRAGRVVART